MVTATTRTAHVYLDDETQPLGSFCFESYDGLKSQLETFARNSRTVLIPHTALLFCETQSRRLRDTKQLLLKSTLPRCGSVDLLLKTYHQIGESVTASRRHCAPSHACPNPSFDVCCTADCMHPHMHTS